MARAEERLRGDKNTFRKLSSSLNIFNKLMAKVPFASRRSSIGEGLGEGGFSDSQRQEGDMEQMGGTGVVGDNCFNQSVSPGEQFL